MECLPYATRRSLRLSGTAIAVIGAAIAATPSHAALVSACTGVSLPRSVVTDIIGGPLTGIVTPIQGTVNNILGVVGVVPIVGQVFPPLSIDVQGLLTQAATGAPLTLQALDVNGVIVGPADQCATTADSFQLDTPASIAIGGNRITGLGGEGLATASAATIGSIALGNGASTSGAATESIAVGPNAVVTAANGVALGGSASVTAANSVALGNGSTAARGAVAGYAAPGLAAPQTSFGEVSAGVAGGERQITNVAAGSAPTDAANVAQLTGAVAASTAAQPLQFSNPATPTIPNGGVTTNDVTLAGAVAGPVTVHNVAPGVLGAGSTDAVNGGQLFDTNAAVTANTGAIAATNTNVTNLTAGINGGTIGLVQQTGGSPGAGPITLGAATGGTSLDLTGTDGTRVVSGVSAGVAATDAANVGQLTELQAATANGVQYDVVGGVRTNTVTLAGGVPGPVTITNVAPGALGAGSTDAVNGAQLFATNTQVGTNTTDIAGNTLAISNLTNGSAGLVQQTGGAPGAGPITIGATTGGTSVTIAGTDGNRVLTGLAPGLGASDAATVGQLGQVVGGSFNAVQYDTDALGGRLNSVTLTGGLAGPVAVGNVAAGALTAASTDAVNGGQLAATNAQVAANTSSIVTNSTTIDAIVAGNAGAFRSNNAAGAAAAAATGANASAGGFGATASGTQSVALGNGAVSTGSRSVALGAQSTDGGVANVVSVGAVGAERRIINVGPAVNGTDAVNLSQLQAATANFTTGIGSLQTQIDGLGFDLRNAKRRANAGTAGAMAVSAIPQAFTEGRGMVGGAVGVWQDQVAFAIGVSKIIGDDTVVKAGASLSGRGSGGFNAGVGFQF